MRTSLEYLMGGGNACPVCGNNDIDGKAVDIDSNIASQEVICHGCGATWTDVYTLQGYVDFTKGEKT